MLVHYIGDESCMVDFPHGNSKRTARPFYPVCPSVRKDIVRKPLPESPDPLILPESDSELVENDPGTPNNPVMVPRNKNQIRNLKRRQKIIESEHRIKKASLENMYDIAMKYPKFVRYIQSSPSLICVISYEDIVSELNDLSKLPSTDPIVFSYSEPFKLGKLFISAFMFTHVAFDGRPGFPTHFVIYDENVPAVHRNLVQILTEDVSFLKDYKGAILISRESCAVDVFHEMLPNLSHIFDWGHLILIVRMWLRSHGFSVVNINMFCDQIRTLLNSTSKELYSDKLQKAMELWTLDFIEFFESEVKGMIEERLGRWILQKYNLFSQPLGVSDIVNQSVQTVFRDMLELRDISVDKIVTGIHLLQLVLINEISKGFCNVGNYKLRPELGFLKRDEDEVFIDQTVCVPDAIITNLKKGTLLSHTVADDGSFMAQAMSIASTGNVVHSSQLQGFLVKSTGGDLQAVTLCPRETCSCGVKASCGHVLAVKYTLGMIGKYPKSKMESVANHLTSSAVSNAESSQTADASSQQDSPQIAHASSEQDSTQNAHITSQQESPQSTDAFLQQEKHGEDGDIGVPTMAEIVIQAGEPGNTVTKVVTGSGGPGVVTLDTFIEALAVARECIVTSATPSTSTATTTVLKHEV